MACCDADPFGCCSLRLAFACGEEPDGFSNRRYTYYTYARREGLVSMTTITDEMSHFPFPLAFNASIASACAILSARASQA